MSFLLASWPKNCILICSINSYGTGDRTLGIGLMEAQMFRNILKTILCAAAMTATIAQAAPVTGRDKSDFDGIGADTYRAFLGANGLSTTGMSSAGTRMRGVRTRGLSTVVVPIGRISVPMAQIPMGRMPMGYSSARRTFSGIVLTAPSRGRSYLPTLGGTDAAFRNRFALPAFDFSGHGNARNPARQGRSRDLKLDYGGEILDRGKNWGHSGRNNSKYRDISDVFVERDINDAYLQDTGGYLEREVDSCFYYSRSSDASRINDQQSFGERLASFPSAVLGAIQQFGEYLACFL